MQKMGFIQVESIKCKHVFDISGSDTNSKEVSDTSRFDTNEKYGSDARRVDKV